MHNVTDNQIDQIIALQLDEYSARERAATKDAVGVLLRAAISHYAALAAEPAQPQARRGVLLEAAKEVESHWNKAGVMVDQKGQAARSAHIHRLILNFEAEAEGVTPDQVIGELIARIAVP